jgi:Asp/Glu/hydantoin racemase
MQPILLINPNTSQATTDMMVAMAQETAGNRARIQGATAPRGPRMITTIEALDAAASDVVEIGLRAAGASSGVVVAAFGDPGADALKRALRIPSVGICAASMIEAGAWGRRFAVATTTPDLVSRIDACAAAHGLGQNYAGTWLTQDAAEDLIDDPARLERALASAVAASIRTGGAAAVIIGGGPLSRAAAALSDRFDVPIIAPVAAAVRYLLGGVAA